MFSLSLCPFRVVARILYVEIEILKLWLYFEEYPMPQEPSIFSMLSIEKQAYMKHRNIFIGVIDISQLNMLYAK